MRAIKWQFSKWNVFYGKNGVKCSVFGTTNSSKGLSNNTLSNGLQWRMMSSTSDWWSKDFVVKHRFFDVFRAFWLPLVRYRSSAKKTRTFLQHFVLQKIQQDHLKNKSASNKKKRDGKNQSQPFCFVINPIVSRTIKALAGVFNV